METRFSIIPNVGNIVMNLDGKPFIYFRTFHLLDPWEYTPDQFPMLKSINDRIIMMFNVFKRLNLLFILSAIATVVTVAEILKNNGLAVEKSKIPVAWFLQFIFAFVSLSFNQNGL